MPSKRHKKRGIRVRDVQRVKKHAEEIPLEAYQRACVAERETDYVTDIQIDEAAKVFEAMLIFQDIDTQWGNFEAIRTEAVRTRGRKSKVKGGAKLPSLPPQAAASRQAQVRSKQPNAKGT